MIKSDIREISSIQFDAINDIKDDLTEREEVLDDLQLKAIEKSKIINSSLIKSTQAKENVILLSEKLNYTVKVLENVQILLS